MVFYVFSSEGVLTVALILDMGVAKGSKRPKG